MTARLRPLVAALTLLFAPAAPAAEPRLDLCGDPLPEGAVARLGSDRFQTDDTIRSITFSPDGKRVAAACHRALFVFDAESGRALRQLRFADGRAGPWAWLPDGRGVLLVLDNPDDPCLVEFTDNRTELLAPPVRPATDVEAAGGGSSLPSRPGPFAFSPDGRLLAAEAYDAHAGERVIGLWETAPGMRFRDLKAVRVLGPPPGHSAELCFTLDGKALGAFCASGKRGEELLVLWDLGSARERCRRPIPLRLQSSLRPVALSPSGRLLAVRPENGAARVYDLDRLEVPRPFGRASGASNEWSVVAALAFSPDGKLLVTAGRDNRVRGWDPVRLEEVRPALDTREWIEVIAFSPDGRRLVAGDSAGALRQWDAGTFREIWATAGHRGLVRDAAASPDGGTAVTAGADGTLRVWDLATGRLRRRIDVNGRIAGRLGLAGDGRTVVVTVDNSPRAWDVTTGQAVPLPGRLARSAGLSHGFGPDGRTLIVSDSGSVSLWDWPTGRSLGQVDLTDDGVRPEYQSLYGACLSPDGKWLVTSGTPAHGKSEFGDTDIWDTATGKRVARPDCLHTDGLTPLFLPGARSAVLGACNPGFIPSGRSDWGPVLGLWDSRTGKLGRRFPLPAVDVPVLRAASINGVAVSPDGRTLAVTQRNGALLYEVATGRARRHLVGHRSGVQAVTFTADGRRLITAGEDETALVWDLTLPGAAAPAGALAEQERPALWAALAEEPAGPAFGAMARLSADPAAGVALLRDRLRPARKPDPAVLDSLFERLDDHRFAVRQQASGELIKLGQAVVGPARQRLARETSEEARARLARLLEEQVWRDPTPEELREGRAVELLEGIGTPEARSLLRELARGEPEALLTQQAAASLRRLEK